MHHHHRRPRRALPALVLAALAALVALAGCGSSSSSQADAGTAATAPADRPLRVGLLQIAEADVLDDVVAAFERRLRAELAPRPVEVEVRNAQGDTTLVQSIARELAASDADMLAVLGTPAVIAVAKAEPRRPVIALAMGDPVGAKVARSLERPGGNVSGSVDFVDPALVLEELLKVRPAPERIGTIYDPGNQNSDVWVKALRAAAGPAGLELKEASIGGPGDIAAAARSIAGDVDAILIGPDATVFAGLAAVASAAGAERVPLYVIGGDPTVAGVFATLGPSYPELGERTGALAAEVAEGADPAATPWVRPSGVEWGINPETLRTLDVTVPAAVLEQAGVR